MAETRKNNPAIGFNNLTYNFKGSENVPINFIKFKGPNHIFKNIHNGGMALEDVEKEQKELKSDLGHIKQGNSKNRSPKQTNKINNIENLCKSREEVLKLFNDYGNNMSKNIYELKHGTGLKILTPKQMLKLPIANFSLTIALAQTKVGNNSERLLNEIRKIVYSLCQSKEITKKVYNNIVKSIKV